MLSQVTLKRRFRVVLSEYIAVYSESTPRKLRLRVICDEIFRMQKKEQVDYG